MGGHDRGVGGWPSKTKARVPTGRENKSAEKKKRKPADSKKVGDKQKKLNQSKYTLRHTGKEKPQRSINGGKMGIERDRLDKGSKKKAKGKRDSQKGVFNWKR